MSPIFVTIFFQGTTHWHTRSCQVRFVPNVGARSVHAAAPVRPGARHRSSALASCEGGAPPKPPWPLKGCGMEGGTLNPTLFKEPFKKGDWDPNKYPFLHSVPALNPLHSKKATTPTTEEDPLVLVQSAVFFSVSQSSAYTHWRLTTSGQLPLQLSNLKAAV